MSTDETREIRENEKLDEVIADYLRAREAGERPDADALIARHPELASELREFLSDHKRVEELTLRLRDAPRDGQRIRYFLSFPSSAWECQLERLCFESSASAQPVQLEAELLEYAFPSRAWERGRRGRACGKTSHETK